MLRLTEYPYIAPDRPRNTVPRAPFVLGRDYDPVGIPPLGPPHWSRGDGPAVHRAAGCLALLPTGAAAMPGSHRMGDETTTATRKPPLCSKCGRPMQLDRIVPRVLYHPGEKTYVCRPCREAASVPDEE